MNKIAYSKYSNERARQFAIRTDILVDETKHFSVSKKNLYPEGRAHIESIFKWYEALTAQYSDTNLVMNRCTLDDSGVSLEYLSLYTLEHKLTQLLQANNIEKFEELLFLYLAEVKKVKSQVPFVLTDAFVEVFGHEEFQQDMRCAQVTDIDMVLNNVIIGEKWTIIDYEWTFDFPIPINFVVYRILHYLIYTSPFKDKLLSLKLMEKAEISEEECAIYARMEEHFQSKYLLTDSTHRAPLVPLREMHDRISPGSIDLKSIYAQQKNKLENYVQIFLSEAGDFSEERSYTVVQTTQKPIQLDIDLDETVQFVRIDPSDCPCVISELTITDNQGNHREILRTSGVLIKQQKFVFLDNDPQLVVDELGDTDRLSLSFKLQILSQDDLELYGDMLSSRQQIADALAQKESEVASLHEQGNRQQAELENCLEIIGHREQEIENMKNTKVWKAYEKYKRTFNKA